MSATVVGKLLKGLYSAAVMFLGSLTTVLTGTATFSDITAGQWVSACLFALVAFGGTFGLAGWSGPSNGAPQSGG